MAAGISLTLVSRRTTGEAAEGDSRWSEDKQRAELKHPCPQQPAEVSSDA